MTPEAVATQKPSRSWLSILLVAALVVLAAALGAFVSKWLFAAKPTLAQVIRTELELPNDQSPSGTARTRLALSPDGTKLVYVAKQRLFLRLLNSLESVPIVGTENATNPFFSPDGQWIAFWASSQIKKVPLSGGTPIPICNAEVIGASWGTDDTILIGGIFGEVLRVAASGGNPETIVRPQPSLAYHHPQFLPGGKSFLYSRSTLGSVARNQVVMRSFDKGDETVLIEGAYNFNYLKAGIIVYTVGNNPRNVDLQAIAFDASARKVIVSPVTIATNVSITTAGSGAQFTVSDSGTLAYLPASADGSQSRLVRVSQTGQVEVLPAEPRLYSDPRVSPDGRFVAAHLQGDENDVWVTSVERGTLTRLSFNPGEDETPAWSPDGSSVAWSGSRADLLRGIFRHPSDGGGSEELLLKLDLHAHVRDWTPDGKALIYETSDPKTTGDIWRLDLEGSPKATPVIQTPFNEHNARLSPDAKWITYSSNESGRDEVYIQKYPEGGSRLTVSTAGGDQPVWARDGRTLFFRSNGELFAVDFVAGPQPVVSNVRSLFLDHFDSPQAGSHTGYDAFPDGKLLMLQSASEKDGKRTKIVLVFNWLEELKQQFGK